MAEIGSVVEALGLGAHRPSYHAVASCHPPECGKQVRSGKKQVWPQPSVKGHEPLALTYIFILLQDKGIP